MKFHRFMLIALFLFSTAAWADEKAPEPFSKYEHYNIDYTVSENGADTFTLDWGLSILKKEAVEDLKTVDISYSTSVEKVEILSAYTKKPDGRHIDVPKDNFEMNVSGGKDKGKPAFSDYTTMAIIFPDVAAGDTLELSYKLIQTEAIFPNQFSLAQHFSTDYEYDDVKVRLDIPTALKAKYAVYKMKKTEDKSLKGHDIINLTFSNKTPVERSQSSASLAYNPESQPGFVVSTFPSYQTIAEDYGQRAKPKAVVTPRIQTLADKITKGKSTDSDKAKALYDWVIDNVTYAGNCIGVGAVVPRDLDFVIDNKMGDCKDHATLLQALLSAKNIVSTQALINAGNVYILPPIPAVSTINHVIDYIPSLDLYLDSTSEYPYGTLPPQDRAKPVLLVDNFKEGTVTPASKPDDLKMEIASTMKIGADGAATGYVDVIAHGYLAITANKSFEKLPKDREAQYMKALLQKHHWEGTATLERGTLSTPPYTYHYRLNYKLQNFVTPKTPGGLYLYALFIPSDIAGVAGANLGPAPSGDFICSGGNYTETYTYEFPEEVKILASPDPVSASDETLKYQSTYNLNGQILTAARTITDVTPGPTCKPSVMENNKKVATKILADLKAQIIYK